MQNVRRDDHVEGMRRESLLERIFLDVEQLHPAEWICGELLRAVCGEARRHIGVDILHALFRKLGKNVRGCSTCAGTELEDTKRCSSRQLFDASGDGLLNQAA